MSGSESQVPQAVEPNLRRLTLPPTIAQAINATPAAHREEHARGVCGIGAHIRSGLSEHYAISLAVPALRFHNNLDALKAALLQCRAEVEAVIGV